MPTRLSPQLRVLSVCLFFVVSPLFGAAQSEDQGSKGHLCGPRSLLVVCQRLGVSASLDELIGLCHYDTDSGTSLLGLYDAARVKGLSALGVKIALEEMATLKVLAIAHLRGDHFAVVEAADADSVRVTDPPGEAVLIEKAKFQEVYSGFALLVAKTPDAFPKTQTDGPDLRVDGYTWDFGSVEEGTVLEHMLTCRNAGSRDLVISGTDTTCGCVQAIALDQSIAPGGKGEITLIFNTAGRVGQQRQTVAIHSNDPVTPVVKFDIQGVVRSSRLPLWPRSVSFGIVKRLDPASAEIYLPKSPDRTVQVEKVISDSQFVETQIVNTTRNEQSGCVISLKLRPGAPLGEFRTKVTVCSNHPKEPKIEIPVTATIKGHIDITPGTLFFGVVKKGQGARHQVTIRNTGQEQVSVSTDGRVRDYLLVRVRPKVEGKEFVLTATLLRSTQPGYIKEDVIVHTSNADQPEIRVPVYALVEE